MKRFQNILVVVDTRCDEQSALQWSVQLAEYNQAKLKIVGILPDPSWLTRLAMGHNESMQQALAEEQIRKLDALAATIRDKGIDVTSQLLFGKASFAIAHEVLRSDHDLVVRVTKGAHSRRTGFFGTTSMRLLRSCPCAIWLVRPDHPPQFARVLAAIDPDPRDASCQALNNAIMDMSQSIVDYENGQLHVVHAWELFGAHLLKSRYTPDEFALARERAKDQVAAVLDRFLSSCNLTHRSSGVHLLCDELGPAHAIAELAKRERIDLIVMGTIARTGLKGAFMGNTAEQVLDRIECPVLAIKPEGYTSPVTLPEA